MKVVIDTNVIVSALLNPYNRHAEILRLLLTGNIELFYDQRILLEYIDVLKRPKFQFNQEHINIFINEIKRIGNLILSTPLKVSLPDEADNMFLEVAISGNIKYIITGNIKHFPKERCQGINVLSPADFIQLYSEGI